MGFGVSKVDWPGAELLGCQTRVFKKYGSKEAVVQCREQANADKSWSKE